MGGEKKVHLNDFLKDNNVSLNEAVQFLKNIGYEVEIVDDIKISVAELRLLAQEFNKTNSILDAEIPNIQTRYEKLIDPNLKGETIDLKQFERPKKREPMELNNSSEESNIKKRRRIKKSNNLKSEPMVLRAEKEIEKELKEFWNVGKFEFEAQYAINKNGKGYFWNLRNTKNFSLILFPNQKRVTIGLPPNTNFEINESYLINTFVAPIEIRKRFNEDYVLFLDNKNNVPKKLVHEAKSFINQLYNEYESVKGIGLDSLKGAINRIATDINRKAETFIFELLQNADDYPNKENNTVEVSFQIIDKYLLFRHNGQPFKANNVRAICSVDAGDKAIDFEKIGYKGIGFKSIFKHSNYVLIDSGEFTFRFDEEFHLNAGRDTFWQLIPIWTERNEIPNIVKQELKTKSNVNIVIRPEEGFDQLIAYENTFNRIFKDERVLLFLRNVSALKFEGKNYSFVKTKDSNKWLNSVLPSITVPEKIIDRINHLIGKDDRIPEKYKDIDSTKITFATTLNDGKIEKTKDTRIFAYLPTDLNFGFPFLVNGDFIPDGGRHYLHADLEWNQFLFEQIGIQLLHWISILWSDRHDDDVFKMLPSEADLIVEKHDDEKEVLLSHFKEGIKLKKELIAFIPCSKNQLCHTGEIIIDDTGLFKENCFGSEIFYELFTTSKFLPLNSKINEYLKIEYLEIEKFSNENLISCFSDESNHEKIKNKISDLEEENYKIFLKKINSLISNNNNNNNNDWVLSLPIMKFDKEVIGLTSLVESKQYILNFSKISGIKDIINKINLCTSDVELDSYSNLFTLFQTKINYINDNKKLFSFIEENGDFIKIDKVEKNKLLVFFNALEDVSLKSCEKLVLFSTKNKSDTLRPLNNLISNNIIHIPKWLLHLIIVPEEEKQLDEVFQKLLIKTNEWLEKIYCNEGLFKSVTEQLDPKDLSDFYAHLVLLQKELPEDKTLAFNNIPWIYCAKEKEFKLPSTIYAPDNFSKLSVEDYQNVSKVIMEISEEDLPCYDSLQILNQFKLGCKKDLIKTIYKTEGVFMLDEMKSFLKWVDEKDFLENFEITKDGENFILKKVHEALQYYTSNKDLITLIEESELSEKLKIFPKELYNEEITKIGLLDTNKLYKYLIENNLDIVGLTPFIYAQKNNDLFIELLNKVNRINLDSTKKYSKESIEFKLFDMIQSLSKVNTEFDEILIDKIYIDNVALDDKNVSDNVFFEFKSNDETKKDEKYELKLSKILPNYKDQTAAITNVIENFESSITYFLKSKIFKARSKHINQIFKEIHEMEEKVLTPYQIFFLLLHKRNHFAVDVFKEKLNFSMYYEKFGEDESYCKNVIEFLEILIHFNCSELNFEFDFNETKIDEYIYEEKYGTEEEILPKFILDWIKNVPEKKDKKLKLLYKLGLNNDDSEIVLLRKGLIENDKNIFEKGKVNLDNETLLLNTMKWIMITQEKGTDFSKQRNLLKDLYEKIEIKYKNLSITLSSAIKRREVYRSNPLNNENQQLLRLRNTNNIIIESRNKTQFLTDKLLIPVLDNLNSKKYFFKRADSLIFHRYSEENWKPYQKDIFDFIKSKEEWVIDDLLPKGFEAYISINLNESEERFESEELLKNSKPILELLPNLSKWSKSEEVSIRVYNESQLPLTLFYNDNEIKTIKNKTELIDGEIYYTCSKEKHSILSSLKNILNEGDYNSLFTFINENNVVVEDADSAKKPISFSEEESQALEKLFGNDIPPEFFKDLNLAACVAALVQLNKDGYDVSKAEIGLSSSHKYSQLEPVIDTNTNTTLIVMCRSAIGGILYIRASSWNRLDNVNIRLFVNTGRSENQFHFFENKQSVLNISKTKYQVFRVEAESFESNTDSILNGAFDKEKVWLIFKMKDKEEYKSIFEGDIRDLEDNPEF